LSYADIGYCAGLDDFAALAHAAHGAIRPPALLPGEADPQDAFVLALPELSARARA
jgi:hypothetical protein